MKYSGASLVPQLPISSPSRQEHPSQVQSASGGDPGATAGSPSPRHNRSPSPSTSAQYGSSLGSHSGGCTMQSCMITFQASPVDTRSSSRSAMPKLWKLAFRVISSPNLTRPNMFTPRTAYMKRIRKPTTNTLITVGSDTTSVVKMIRRPLRERMRRKTLATRKTRMTFVPISDWRKTPMIERTTRTKSRQFHPLAKYSLIPRATILREASNM
mmetsp:Transcript_3561/g.8503  ORF Transcript_3561/g.8503 Transcript_3561/m.8503 type:complete len:213 (-) Transcript_3561:384-1022(-)